MPSLLITRPDVGGTSGGLQGVYSARGTSAPQNSQFLNGINVGDPQAIGAAGFYYDFDAFDDIQVSTGAHDITVPTSGVFLNMVTKGGTNQWRGRSTFTWLGDATQSQNIDAELLRATASGPETNSVDFVSDINVSGGGPVIATEAAHLRSFRDWRVHVNVPAAFSELVLDKTDITSGLVNADLPDQRQEPADRLLLAAGTTRSRTGSSSPPTTNFERLDQQRTGHVRRLPGAVELGRDQTLFVDARLGLEQDQLPDLPQRQRPDAARHGHQHPHAQLHRRHRALARSLPGQRHGAVLRRRVRSAAGTS